ncbi:hypothetical protein C0991_007684 [Blastosporella zonata]|nr:hypothetical protein C0991_007684 [Blastosporella zonata]
MLSKTFFALAVIASGVVAQSGTDTSSAAEPSTSLPAGLDSCIIGCIQPAATAVGCDFTDASCVCSNTDFQTAAAACLQANCTASDLQAALTLQEQECNALTASITGSATTEASASTEPATSASVPVTTSAASSSKATSTAPSSSRAATSSASAPATTTTNAAVGREGAMGLVGVMVAAAFGLML